ncbi:hypothetical protein Nepgr_026518 [Nepenthes gracilis]|uniref:Uncharacterized protein n=1 Tax=Nepenthes gracilis TaxID=150966 RepID=A0AAD3Y243_NEPGR|nr:hypothetical protein Nepgr_026518 [Nepenthes gracilis]
MRHVGTRIFRFWRDAFGLWNLHSGDRCLAKEELCNLENSSLSFISILSFRWCVLFESVVLSVLFIGYSRLCFLNQGHCKQYSKGVSRRSKLHLLSTTLLSRGSQLDLCTIRLSESISGPLCFSPCRYNVVKSYSFLGLGQNVTIPSMKTTAVALTRSYNALQSSPLVIKMIPAIGIIVFALWGLEPLMQKSRIIFLHKSDNSWKKSTTHYVMTSYLQPILMWTGATLICRALDPVVMPSEASLLVKQRFLNFVKSLSTVLAFACCLSGVIRQAQRVLMETNDHTDARNMGFQFAGKAVYTAVWVAAFSLFMELLGFSTQKWLTAGGLGTVLLTLAGREIFTNFLSSAMIHMTRPFVLNEWIQTKIEGYEVSGTVEHVGWWSPTIVRGEDREAVHIPNHKFTVNVIRNLSQKTHWRIKTHLAISHLDVNKINKIVADMRKVLAKNPQVEQQKLHRRVFLDNINPENQSLLILISCFVKTSHFEEYLCVKEAILMDLLRVVSHHRARLATPIRTIQKIYSDPDLENVPFAETIFTHGGAASNRPLLLIEPPYKTSGEDKSKSQARPVRSSGDQDRQVTMGQPTSESKARETSKPGIRAEAEAVKTSNPEEKDESRVTLPDSEATAKTSSRTAPDRGNKAVDVRSFDAKGLGSAANRSRNSNPEESQPSGKIDSPAASEINDDTKSKQSMGAQPPKPRPALDDNIVLGVALEGSKRTLPIEEGLASPSDMPEAKELAGHRNANGTPDAEKDEKGS